MSDFLDEVTTIKGRFVELRPVSGADFPTLYKWRSSFTTVHQLNFRRAVTTYETFVREIESMLPSSIMLLIRDRRTREPIGYALGYNVNPWDRYMGGSIFIEPSRRMRVYGGEAMVLAVDFIFSLYPVTRSSWKRMSLLIRCGIYLNEWASRSAACFRNTTGTMAECGHCT